MANSYRKIYLHLVFAVKYRNADLHKSWRGELFKYIFGIINKRGHYALAVNGYNDHVHIFFNYQAHELIKDLVREIKKASNAWINERNLIPNKFHWQTGYGIFSQGYNDLERIMNYIKNQEAHHENNTFKKEYLHLLELYEVDYQEAYVFNFFEEKSNK